MSSIMRGGGVYKKVTLNDNGREGGLPESDVISQYFRFEIIVFILVAITIKIMNWGGGVSQHLRFKLCLELSSKERHIAYVVVKKYASQGGGSKK